MTIRKGSANKKMLNKKQPCVCGDNPQVVMVIIFAPAKMTAKRLDPTSLGY